MGGRLQAMVRGSPWHTHRCIGQPRYAQVTQAHTPRLYTQGHLFHSSRPQGHCFGVLHLLQNMQAVHMFDDCACLPSG